MMKVLILLVFLNCISLCFMQSVNRKVPTSKKSTTAKTTNTTTTTTVKPSNGTVNIKASNSSFIPQLSGNGTAFVNGTDGGNGTNRHWMFPGQFNPMFPGQNPMLGGAGMSPMMPPFNPNGIPGWGMQGCRDWCLSANGGMPYCCDGLDPFSLRCPGDRDVCPFPNRSLVGPRICQFHNQCAPMELCCPDVCLKSRVCKPVE